MYLCPGLQRMWCSARDSRLLLQPGPSGCSSESASKENWHVKIISQAGIAQKEIKKMWWEFMRNAAWCFPGKAVPAAPLASVALCNNSELPFGASICSFSRFQIKINGHCCNCLKTHAKFYRGFIAKDR